APTAGRRSHDGADVRVFPKSGEPYKKTHLCAFSQELVDDEDSVSSDVQQPETLSAKMDACEEAPDRFSVCIVGAGAIGCHLAYVLQK
ncbi:unnamed protein product, partial [Polarella glacialis]